jgi:uncharacterized protein (TIGR02001 family)
MFFSYYYSSFNEYKGSAMIDAGSNKLSATPVLSPCMSLIRSFYLFLRLLPLFLVLPLHSEIVGEIGAGTNYLWRGVTQTDDNPAFSAALEYRAEQGTYLGLWGSNTEYGGRKSHELQAYLGQTFELQKAAIDLSVRHYYFPSGGKYSYDFQPEKWENKESSAFSEVQISATYDGWNAAYAYSNDYLDSGKVGYYIQLNYTFLIRDELSLTLHLGSQKSAAIDDYPEQSVGDHSATLKWKNVFFTASNMTDNEDGRQSDKVRYLLGVKLVFGEK